MTAQKQNPSLENPDTPLTAALRREGFLPIRDGETVFYGGNQNWLRGGLWGTYAAKTGCGAVAALNVACYLSGSVPADRAAYTARLREALRFVQTPVLSPRRLGRAVQRLLGRGAFRVLDDRSAALRDALDAIAASLRSDRPVAMQVLRSGYAKAAGPERVIPWHWTVITGLAFDPAAPEDALCTFSTWGEKRLVRFSNAWRGGGGIGMRTSLVFFDG